MIRTSPSLASVCAILVAICLFSPGTVFAQSKILALGTSLTQGYGLPPGTEYPARLEAQLRQSGTNIRIINAGVSGDTSAGGLSRLDWALAETPTAAIVELGSNDALRGLSPAQTEKNLAAILEKFKARKIPVLLLGMQAPRNLGKDYVAEFDAIYPRLAKRYDLLFYPFVLEGIVLNPKLNQADGIHPNPEGVKVLVKALQPYVEKLLRK